MQRRVELNQIVGYQSRGYQIAAHMQTAIPAALISMQVCRYLFGWLSATYYDFTLLEFAILAAGYLIVHINNNYGAHELNRMQAEAKQLAYPLPRVSQLEMCLFSSPDKAYSRHRHTVVDSVIAGAVFIKMFQLLTEGILRFNLPFIGAALLLLILLANNFTRSIEENYGAAVIRMTIP